jgi:hypothetical protein
MVIRVYIKDRNLCVILDFQMTLHSAVLWIYQVKVKQSRYRPGVSQKVPGS